MGVEDIEARALRLPRRDRARLALRLLESLETLTDDENAAVWAEEAQRRSDAWDADPTIGRPADEVFRDARARLKTLGQGRD